MQRARLAAHFDLHMASEPASGRAPFVAPSTPVEKLLAEFWSHVLGTPLIGIHDGLFADPGDWWLFIDWSDELDRTAAMQAVLVFGYWNSPNSRVPGGKRRATPTALRK